MILERGPSAFFCGQSCPAILKPSLQRKQARLTLSHWGRREEGPSSNPHSALGCSFNPVGPSPPLSCVQTISLPPFFK